MSFFRARARGLLVALVVTALFVVAAALAGQWWFRREARRPALAFAWPATVIVVAGDGTPGDRNGPADAARFTDPFGLAVAADGTVFVADGGPSASIRRIAPDGTVTTLAGGTRGWADGVGAEARFDAPSALAMDRAGNLIVADTGNHAIRRITPTGTVTTLAGTGEPGYRDGPGHLALLNGPIGVAVDAVGRVIVADTYNDRIRAVLPDGQVVTVAGNGGVGAQDGDARAASFNTPAGVAVSPSGDVYVADTGNSAVRVVTPAGQVETLSAIVDGGLWRPVGIVADAGSAFVTDARGRILRLARDGRAAVLAGSASGFAEGSTAEARFRQPSGLALVADGRLLVADAGNHLVRQVAAPGHDVFRTPLSPRVPGGFDAEAFAMQPLLWPVAPMGGPHEVAGTIGEPRGDPGGTGYDRFHAGVDVREPDGTPVVHVRAVEVRQPISTSGFGAITESLSVPPLAYVHVRVGRDARQRLVDPRFLPVLDDAGKLVGIRVRRGTRFETGDPVGTINRFSHVHLNVGFPGEEVNPLLLRLPTFDDHIAPTIPRGGVTLFDEQGTAFRTTTKGRLVVRGRVEVVVEAWDRADASLPRRRLGVYRLGFQVLDNTGTPLPGFERMRETQRFDRVTSMPSAPLLVFAPGSGIPYYGTRSTRFLYRVTTTFRDGRAERGWMDTTTLPEGPCALRVFTADTQGNETEATLALEITR